MKFTSDKAKKMIMCGYAENHARDTYRLLKVDTKSVMQIWNIKWAAWKPSEPGDGIHIEVEEIYDKEEDLDKERMPRSSYLGLGACLAALDLLGVGAQRRRLLRTAPPPLHLGGTVSIVWFPAQGFI